MKARLSTGALSLISKMAAVEIATLGTITVTCIIAAIVLAVIFYIGFKSKQQQKEISETLETKLDERPVENGQKRDKGKQSGKAKRGAVTLKSHHRQFAILKGHTGHVFDLEFSLNGKYLASTSQGYHKKYNIEF